MIKNFKDCLKAGKIKKFSRGKELASKELRLAQEDLKAAKQSFADSSYRWSIVQVYYSMFHSARVLIYHKNYRERSHYCLAQSIRELYVKSGELSVLFLEALLEAKRLRESADYYGDFSEMNAKKLLGKAKDFLEEAKGIITK